MTKIRIILSVIFNTSCPAPSILYFGIFHLAVWSFPFLFPIFLFYKPKFQPMLTATNTVQRQSCISEFLSSTIENLKLEKETCFITFQAPTNLFFYLLPLSIIDIRNAKNQLPRIVLWTTYIVLRTIYIM